MQHYQTHYHCYLRPLRTVFSEFLSCFASWKKCSIFNSISFIATILCIALSNGSFKSRFNLAGIVFHGNLKDHWFILLNWKIYALSNKMITILSFKIFCNVHTILNLGNPSIRFSYITFLSAGSTGHGLVAAMFSEKGQFRGWIFSPGAVLYPLL